MVAPFPELVVAQPVEINESIKNEIITGLNCIQMTLKVIVG
jgi:hypothetical protein